MKKLNYKRISLLLLLTIICIPLCACKKPETEEPSEQPNEQIQAPTRTPSTDKNEKNEMVYVILDKTGKKQKVIVNHRIINKQCLDEIKDLTNLDNLKLIKGNATFTKDLNNVTWNANKEDIYYTGETDKEIPVNISIKYYLNENEVTYEQLQGKSGKVTIRFDYTCNQSEIVKINNEDKTIYVPYLIISGVAFNNAKTANITSQNGKVIDDGKNSFVVGCAIPGLKEDLEIEDLNIPTYFEISMDAVDFNMDTTFSVATNQFMNGINSNDIKDEKQKTKVNTLCLMLAKEELLPTVNEVVKSLDEYNDYYKGVIDYTSGVDQMDQEIKAGNLEDKLQELLDGSKKLNDGTIKLNTELQEFYENTLKDILEKYNNDFTNMVERICIINDVIAKYQMFTSVSRDMIGKTTYIYTTK